jgi:hypothetical protein
MQGGADQVEVVRAGALSRVKVTNPPQASRLPIRATQRAVPQSSSSIISTSGVSSFRTASCARAVCQPRALRAPSDAPTSCRSTCPMLDEQPPGVCSECTTCRRVAMPWTVHEHGHCTRQPLKQRVAFLDTIHIRAGAIQCIF